MDTSSNENEQIQQNLSFLSIIKVLLLKIMLSLHIITLEDLDIYSDSEDSDQESDFEMDTTPIKQVKFICS